MYADRSVALLADTDQWARCSHDGTVLLRAGGVGLDWTDVPPPARWDDADGACVPTPPAVPPVCPGGIASNRWCRTWRSRPELGTLDLHPRGQAARSGVPGGLRHPTGLAVDGEDRLYVVEAAGRAIVVVDLVAERVLHRVPVAGRPLDVVAWGPGGVLVLTASPRRVVRLDGRRGPCPGPGPVRRPCGRPGLSPARLAVLSGRVVVLWRGRDTAVVADLDGTELVECPGATDIAATTDGLLVVALQPGRAFRRYGQLDGTLVEDEPLAAADYDGGAVGIDPTGRVVYTTAGGSRTTQGPLARHVRQGVVTTYRLDSGAYRTRWGRLFLDACLPTGTGLVVRALTSDEDEVDDPLVPGLPARGGVAVPFPEQTPPLPAVGAMDAVAPVPVVRRGNGPGLGAVDPFVTGTEWTTYETGIAAPPGRYLWLRLELSGTGRTSPKLRALRVERPGHALLSALPRMYSSVDEQADFLHGYLTPAEGLLHDLDTAAAERRVLVSPTSAPADFLPWLASLAGIVLDLRWPEAARRALLAEVYRLYAFRGTQAALERLLRLYLGRDARIIERWRLRGLGGAVLGFDPEGLDSPTVSGTTRRAGMLGHFTIGGALPSTDSYRRLAHRFTVLVPGCLTSEQREVVGDIIAAHKPSHTLADVCELGDGLPVGRLRLGLTAYVAPRAGRRTGVLGRARLGADGTLGTPVVASRVGSGRLGAVRVG
ncbi:MAG: phage tail protein [Propionicimonas sp.]|uniref:phage tail protein n=1 Tax=Propionicimonas sp. TaxID=1955623 RepID=UPI003D1091CC